MMMVLKFLEPLGRPAGLPLLPLGNCVCFGGLPRPAFCSEPLIFARFLAMSHLLGAFAFQTFKIEFGFHMYRLEAVRLVESADNGVDVMGIDFDPKAAPSGFFGCDQSRTATGEGIEYDSPTFGARQARCRGSCQSCSPIRNSRRLCDYVRSVPTRHY